VLVTSEVARVHRVLHFVDGGSSAGLRHLQSSEEDS
jgi:hypothetical protein